MPLRAIKKVTVRNQVKLASITALDQLYDHRTLRCTVLRHFGPTRQVIATINKTLKAFYFSDHDAGLVLPVELAQEFGILDGEWLEVVCTHALTINPRGKEVPPAGDIFPERDVVDLDFDPDAESANDAHR